MKKLYAGLAAAALTATGIACTAGAAHAEGTWPDQFRATQIVSAPNGASFLVGQYDTGIQQSDDSGNTWDETAGALVEMQGSTVNTIALGGGASPSAIAVHDDTVYVVGTDADDNAELWTVSDSGTVTSTQPLPNTGEPQSVAVSSNGDRVAVAGWDNVVVFDADMSPTATMPTASYDESSDAITGVSGFGGIAFAPGSDVLQIAGTDYDQNVDLWSLDSDSAVTSQVIESAEHNAMATGIAVATDGTTYVTTTNGDAELIAVKGPDITAQAAGSAQGVALSADGSTAYVASYGGVGVFATDALGTYGDNPNPSYYPGDSVDVDALALNASGDVVIAESQTTSDDSTGTSTTGNQVVDVVTAPGAPSKIKASRDVSWVDLSFTPAATTGSSARPTDLGDLVTYTVTLHDTTHPAVADITEGNWFDPSDITLDGITADAYAVSVTATNGLFTSPAATYSLPAYKAPAGGGSHTSSPPVSHPTPAPPAQVTKIKAAKIKSTSKKLTLKLAGVTTVPGKVKVYDGKKLIGKATIKDGKLVLKLKKKLHKGKHKITVKYAGSAQVAKFNKSVKVKVK